MQVEALEGVGEAFSSLIRLWKLVEKSETPQAKADRGGFGWGWLGIGVH